jgi:protein-S-isoprenylcysteine O-methyltransferase Ste14
MTTYDDSQPLDFRQTAKGIAVRAGILSVVSLVLGAWLFSLAAKVASGAVKVLTGVILLGIGGAVAAWEVRKVQRHIAGHREHAELP